MLENVHSWPLEHWLIELCTKCSLECPRCLRQEQGTPVKNKDLELSWFESNFTGKLLTDLRKITFSGVRGDPIYAKHLLEVMTWFRKHNDKVGFTIITNGSYKTKKWWNQLGDILNEKDNIHFSIDGWDQASNSLYRINCDWDSIILGINTLKDTKAYKTQASIVFKFNEHKIDYLKSRARELGFDEFQLTLSAKFNKVFSDYPENDPLQPDDQYIASKKRHDRIHYKLSNKYMYTPLNDIYYDKYKNFNTENTILPICMIGNKGLYINASGDFYPCCWTEHEYNSELPQGKNIFNYLAKTQKPKLLGDRLNDPMWGKVFSMMSKPKPDKTFTMCMAKCSKANWSQDHATQF